MWNKIKNIFKEPTNALVVWMFIIMVIVVACIDTCYGQTRALQRGGAGTPFTAYPQEEYDKSERKYWGVSAGFDIANAIVGGKKLDNGERRNEQALAYQLRLLYGEGSMEAGATYFNFHQIGFQSFSVDINYVGRIWSDIGLVWIAGLERRWIWREAGILHPPNGSSSYGARTRTWGANNRFRIENPFGIPGAVEWQTGYIRRADQRDLAENNLMDEPIPGFWDSISNYFNLIIYIE
jgi:hypothetical protein